MLSAVMMRILRRFRPGYAWRALALVFTLGLISLTHARAATVELSSLDLAKMSTGWGRARANRSIQDKPLAIGGRRFERGVGSHAPSQFWINLAGQATSFSARVGVDDEVGSRTGTILFQVLGDGREFWNSGLCKTGQPAKACQVNLQGVRQLTLIADDAGDGINYDHADWAEAVLVMNDAAAPPRALDIPPPPREEAVILTPPPPAEPRINGPRVFGVRPGHPFLFTIPATGERPLTFAARNLPQGLALDPASGRLTGAVAAPGDFRVTLEVRNARGQATRDFRITVGDTLALTPPMGWNSWYCLLDQVTDAKMRRAADAMVSSGLIDHGYSYVNIDDCWAVKPDSPKPELGGAPRDARGNVRPNKRFPDMKALTDYIHSKGLKAGIYTSPGPRTCAGHVGAYQFEKVDADQFAAWGFDFLKYDWCSYGNVAGGKDREHLVKPYQVMWDALKKQDRDIVFNLCQYGMGNVWEWGAGVGNCWRTTGDLNSPGLSVFQSLSKIGFGQAGLERYAGPGHWNDPDYILLGYINNFKGGLVATPLTPNEQYTYVSLWCLLTAPLIFSGDMEHLDPFTLSLLTNDEVLEVDQDPLGRQAARLVQDGNCEIWAKPMEDGSLAVGSFNRGPVATTIKAEWAALKISGSRRVRDLWRQKDLGNFNGSYETEVPRHGVVLLRLFPA